MKKILVMLFVLMVSVQAGFAQFEKGKVYFGGAVDAAGFSYDSTNKFSFGLGARAGYMFADSWMAIGDVNLSYSNKTFNNFKIGGAARYCFTQNGIFLQGGIHYQHFTQDCCKYNTCMISPEVGYSFFLGGHVVVEPSIYYDMSVNKFSDLSKAGARINLVVYFDGLKKL